MARMQEVVGTAVPSNSLCFMNEILNLNFPVSSTYIRTEENQRDATCKEVLTAASKMVKFYISTCKDSPWLCQLIVAIDNCQLIVYTANWSDWQLNDGYFDWPYWQAPLAEWFSLCD